MIVSSMQESSTPSALSTKKIGVRSAHNVDIVPADQFTLQELTDAYNQTRIDYIIPMPMTAARLQEYMDVYDIDLAASCMALDRDSQEPLGLGMLGIRRESSWITRLGVLPASRGRRVGQSMVEFLLDQSKKRHMESVWLEVIKDNEPAHRLFQKLGFVETRQLIVARRPPVLNKEQSLAYAPFAEILKREEALELLATRQPQPNWLNQTECFHNIAQIHAFRLSLPDGRRGWLVYEASMIQLKRITVGVEAGDVVETTHALLEHLHTISPRQDAVRENISEFHPGWTGYERVGYFESFRRIEMMLAL